jgi:hypothetical protein
LYVFYYLLDWAPAPLGGLDLVYSPPPARTGFYLVDSLLAGIDPRHLHLGADRPHEAPRCCRH